MPNVFEVLQERGFIYQTTDDEGLKKLLKSETVTFYIGFDPTASSFHVGNLLPIMAMMHMQRAGHKPIAIVGGGTGMVGDPSGKTESRKVLPPEQIQDNVRAQKKQLSNYIDFGEGKAVLFNNADWISNLNYIDFLRDIGIHFSVNKMLTSESVKQRLETGLSFLEFNYVLLQAYDFYVLMRDHNCVLQMGGQDQWGNIVAGMDLARRKLSKECYGITFPLITNSSGEKFGKSLQGAVWLDSELLSPYEYYQFWRNVEDTDVERLLGLFTFLPMDEVKRMGSLTPPLLNRAKEILAFEAVKITHGRQEAVKAYSASIKKFAPADPDNTVETSSDITVGSDRKADIPFVTLLKEELHKGYWVVKLLSDSGLVSSNGEARRLIKQGGAYINEERVGAEDLAVTESYIHDGAMVLRMGKKKYLKVVFS